MTAAIRRLNNGKASGPDNIKAELLKYGPEVLHKRITDTLNTMFERHEPIDAIGEGELIPLNKPNKKAKLPSNTRPIILLNMIRKVLSNIILERIYPLVENYVSITQSGFRRYRSTSDVVWTYRWMMAYTAKFDITYHLTGIDLSKAFDCINRSQLLDILKEEVKVPESDLRILQYLLSNTFLRTSINQIRGAKFQTTTGTPQGDALSPILFIVYLESAFRHFKRSINFPITHDRLITHYADDTDFISKDVTDGIIWVGSFSGDSDILEKYHLKLNQDKTEFITLQKGKATPSSVRKLGTKLNDTEDITYRAALADLAFQRLQTTWKSKKHIKLPTKIRLYNATVKPILLYNASCLGTAGNKSTSKLATTHRKHLRSLCSIHYTSKTSNKQLMKRTNSKHLTIEIATIRLSLFGHILRQPTTPAHQIMEIYFATNSSSIPNPLREPQLRYQASRSTLVYQLQIDFKKYETRLINYFDFFIIKHWASNRDLWKRITTHIISAYENDIKLDEDNKETGKRKRQEKTRNQGSINNSEEMRNKDNQQEARTIANKRTRISENQDQEVRQYENMDIDNGINEEDEEALAAGRESDKYERMIMDEG